ncbi:uncharacterized protein LOC118403744 [Branchiostoma floridae]|uniref:Uncharacterized protein LOC118403744 n=1 Tax=Branchiostoma floridae TaxID=7739 RepID=A0A9J7HI23_BRAFL|nr:uncharacterized protein LOC118403744 [Branchiostoma floridae]
MAENLSPPGNTEFSALFDEATVNPSDDSMECDKSADGDDTVEYQFDSDATFCSEVEWGETLDSELEIGAPLRSSTPYAHSPNPTDLMEWNSSSADLFAPSITSSPTDDRDMSADMFGSASSFEEALPVATVPVNIGEAEVHEQTNVPQEEAMDLRTMIQETQDLSQPRQVPVPQPLNPTARPTEPMNDSVLDLRTVIQETQFE